MHILLAVHLGLRKEDVIGLKWDVIDFDNNTITIKHTVINASKNGKRILVKKNKIKNDSSYNTTANIYSRLDINTNVVLATTIANALCMA